MNEPAIVPMKAGETPTHGGFYSVRDQHGSVAIVLVPHRVLSGYDDLDVQYVLYPGTAACISWDGLTFIARIYPDRIGQE